MLSLHRMGINVGNRAPPWFLASLRGSGELSVCSLCLGFSVSYGSGAVPSLAGQPLRISFAPCLCVGSLSRKGRRRR